MNEKQVQTAIADWIEHRYDVIGFDAPDSLRVVSRHEDGIVLEDEAGAQFFCSVRSM